MATLKQIQANTLNAQNSTGPRTEAGKAAARNSLTHGCYASQVVLQGQDQELFQQLYAEFMAELQPQTLRERNLVEMMIAEWWHLGQCEFMRQSFFAHQLSKEEQWHQDWAELSPADRLKFTAQKVAFFHLKDMNRISELKSRVYRSYHRASREFDCARAERLRREGEAAGQAPSPAPSPADAPEPAPEPIVPSPTPAAPAAGPAPPTNIRWITPRNAPDAAPPPHQTLRPAQDPEGNSSGLSHPIFDNL